MARDVFNKKRTSGEILKQLRREKLWTQEELASRLATTTTSVGRWENNVTRPGMHFQQQLCQLFGKTPEELGFLPPCESELEFAAEEEVLDNILHQPDPQAEPQVNTLPQDMPSGLDLDPHSMLFRRRKRMTRSRNARLRVILLVSMAGLSILLLLSGVFWLLRPHALSSTVHHPSCHIPSSDESAPVIYTQVICTSALLSSTLAHEDALQWDENNQCLFTQGAYHVLLPATMYVSECFAHAIPFLRNFALQVDITVLKGYSGGLVFLAAHPSPNWDVITSRLPIDIWGQYNFFLDNMNVPCHLTKDAGDPNYCHSPQGTLTYGLGATNTITVIVLDSLVYFYANGTFIDQAKVPASVPPLNYIGVFATGVHTPSDIAFSNFSLWNI